MMSSKTHKFTASKGSLSKKPFAKTQLGMALITVLFVVALTVIVAVEMSMRLQLQVSRTTNMTSNRQAYWYAVSAEELVKQKIKKINTEKDSKSQHIHSGQDWAAQGIEFPVDGGTIGGELKDLQSCFNLNALATDKPDGNISVGTTVNGVAAGTGVKPPASGGPTPSPNPPRGGATATPTTGGGATAASRNPKRRQGITYAMEVFQRLLEQLEIDDIAEVPSEYLMQRAKDWVDSDGMQTGGGGMEEDDYRGLEIPYLAPNTLMASESELRMISGFTPQVIAKIKPYICVIPGSSQLKININTVDAEQAELVSAMFDGLSVEDAKAVISGGQPEGYEKVKDFIDRSEFTQLSGDVKTEAEAYFDVTTQYFALKAQSSFGDSKFYLNSKLHVNQSKQVTVIARRFGVDL